MQALHRVSYLSKPLKSDKALYGPFRHHKMCHAALSFLKTWIALQPRTIY